jgi:hypothetical protein
VDSSVRPGSYSTHHDLVVDHRACDYTKPYFPSYENHCIAGNSKILEIPISNYPYIQIKTRLVSVFIPKNIPMPLTKDKYYKTNSRIRKLVKKRPIVTLVLICHPWELLGNTENKLRYIERFILDMKSFNARFVTLIELKKWLKSTTEVLPKNENMRKKSRFIITKWDILKLAKQITLQRHLI